MPIASGGRRSSFARPSASSSATKATPASAPQRSIGQLRSPPSTPFASAEISPACGAASACGPAPGAPAKPKAVLSRSMTTGTTSAPKHTPITSATCCFHGVAPTSWPVLRSCRLSFEIVATPKTMPVTISA